MIAENTTLPWLPGVVLAIVCLLTGLAIRHTAEPPAHVPTSVPGRVASNALHARMACGAPRIFQDLWQVARSRTGYLGLLICFSAHWLGRCGQPVSLFAAERGASANDVAATSRSAVGLLSAVGCMVGGHFCDRMDRRTAYALFGALMVACALLMAWAPIP